jgi:hypothetical protein
MKIKKVSITDDAKLTEVLCKGKFSKDYIGIGMVAFWNYMESKNN